MEKVIPILLIIAVVVIIGLGGFYFLKKRKSPVNKKSKKGNISEWSFQRFSRFYGYNVLPDPKFNEKIEKVKSLILNKKLENIDEIANLSGCNNTECLLMIIYLKNKRVLGEYSIDKYNNKVRPCSDEELKLIKKYGDLVYTKHYQINEIANEVPNYHNMPIAILREDIYKDLKYMNDRYLLNGIKINELDKKIVYYTLEKHKKAETHKTLNCPSCGILVDVEKGGKASCSNCGTIVDDSISEEKNVG